MDLFREDAQPEMPAEPERPSPETDRELPEAPSPKEVIPDTQTEPEQDFELDRDRQPENMFDEPPELNLDQLPEDDLDRDRQPEDMFPEPPGLDLDGVPEDDLDRDLYDEDGRGELDGTDQDDDDEDAIPCDRAYNDRNCCREDRECLAVLERIERRTIDTISLDITPPFVVQDGASEDEDPEDIKAKKLAEAPYRTWTNRDGEVIASGYLHDLANRGVMVRDDEDEITTIRFIDLSRDDICFVTAYWNLPAECPLPGDAYAIRDFTMLTYTWTASGQCHKPLYFENVALERYGHSAGPIKQQFWSAAHFFGSAIVLPYSMGLYPPNECRYALGYYEPGDCAPWMIHAFPLSKRAALAELSFILGFWGIVQ